MTYVLSDIHGNLQRFKSIMAQINLQADSKKNCENTEVFTKTIAEGIKNADEREAEQERIANTVRGQLMRHPECSFDIMTADGRVQLMPEDIKAMLGGEKQDIRIDGVIYAAYELLDMEVVDMQSGFRRR